MWMFPKIGGTPKWMVYNRKPNFSMDDLGGKPTIFGNIHVDFFAIVNWYFYNSLVTSVRDLLS